MKIIKYLNIFLIWFLAISSNAAPPLKYSEQENITGKSSNKKFIFSIKKESINYKSGWVLQVFNNDSVLIWEKEYRCDMLPSGELQDDGKYFIDFNSWNSEESTVITIYRKDTANIEITGKFFNIPKDALIEHTDYVIEWFKNYKIQNDSIIIHTNDDIIWSINYKNGITNKKQYNHIVKTKSLFEKYLIIIIVFGIFFLIFLIRKKYK